jgi:hypothetical protein
MIGSLPFNLKHTYQTKSIYPFFLFSIICLEHNVLQIVIITLFCGSKNIPNLIILLNLDLLSLKIRSHYLLNYFFVTLPIWNSNTFWNLLLCRLLLLWWSFLMLLQNIPLPLLYIVRNENWTNLFTCAYLSSKLSKIVLPQSFFNNFYCFF